MIVYKSKISGKWYYLDKEQFKILILGSLVTIETLFIGFFIWFPFMVSPATNMAKIIQTVLTGSIVFFIGILNWYTINFCSYVFDLIKKKVMKK